MGHRANMHITIVVLWLGHNMPSLAGPDSPYDSSCRAGFSHPVPSALYTPHPCHPRP